MSWVFAAARIAIKPPKIFTSETFQPVMKALILVFFFPLSFKHLLSQGHNANGQGTLFSSEQMPAGRQIPQGLLGKCGREFRSINTLPLSICRRPGSLLALSRVFGDTKD